MALRMPSYLLSVRLFASRRLPFPFRSSHLLRLRPVAAVQPGWSPAVFALGTAGFRCFSTRPTTSSLNDPSPNWSNRPPKETVLLDGCDFEHWLVVVEPPEEGKTRDEIIDSYIKTLAKVIGSEEEARMKIYSVSTKHYFAFGALVSEELSYKIKELPGVRWVLPDSYLDVKNKDYGGEPFINGQAVPYDPKYHEEWVRNNARANERSRRNDRPRNFDRSRNFERRRENMQNRDFQSRTPMPNPEPSMQGPPPHMPSAGPNMQGPPPPSAPQYMNRDPANVPPNPPSYHGAPYQNQRPGYHGNYAPPMHNPEFQNRGQSPMPPSAPQKQGHMSPSYAPPSISQPSPPGVPYSNQGLPQGFQGNFVPNRDGSSITYQGGDSSYQGAGGPYQGSGPPGGAGSNPYQVGGGGIFQGTDGSIPQV